MENASSGSRHLALQECKNSGPGTVGAVIARILELPGVSLTVRYEIASGDIGAFYQRPETKAILRSPWTDTNLQELAIRETLFIRHNQVVQGLSVGHLVKLAALKLCRLPEIIYFRDTETSRR